MGGSSAAPAEPVKVDTNKKDGKPIVDPEKPKTSMRIRFHNGQSGELEVNLDHLVSDVIAYVESVAPIPDG